MRTLIPLAVLLLSFPAFAAPATNYTLGRTILKAPRSAEAKKAVEELDQRGEKGWRTLASVVRDLGQKDVGAARGVLAVLAGDGQKGTEPGRLEALKQAWRAKAPAAIRADVAKGLAVAYPKNKTLLLKALFDKALPERAEMLRRLAAAQLENTILRKALTDATLAGDAYALLIDRGVSVSPAQMRQVAAAAVERGQSPQFIDAFCTDLKQGNGWPLLSAIALLTKDSDQHIVAHAHGFLMRVSGKDMIPDPDIWNSWIAARRDTYEIPEDDSDGRIAAAVVLGAEFLRRDLLDDGRSAMAERRGGAEHHAVGATALSVLALLAAGAPADDPAIVKAVETTFFTRNEQGQRVLAEQARRHTYTSSLVLMAFAALDKKVHRNRIQSLASLIASSQLRSGQWNYRLHDRYASRERRRRAKNRIQRGDNSNTQYALLALRAARKAGADVSPEVWLRALSYWHLTLGETGWSYTPRTIVAHGNRSMTAAGISSLAICMEGLYGKRAAARIAEHAAVAKGLVELGKKLIQWGYDRIDLYAYYGIERACVLTGTRKFNEYDWYKRGASELIRGQATDGAWWSKDAKARRGKGWGYGPAIETAYALLFLRRATTRIDGTKEHGVVRVPGTRRRNRNERPARMVRNGQ